ncbi:hypothetical protein [Nonomuraea helvata]|uniref:Uncharacterized protein n=1 Tax=Nonomuraea helvata TaxID=37484 RepID=A0ABV5SCY7_9ACTN
MASTNVARRILAIQTSCKAAMTTAVDQLGTTSQLEELGGVRRSWEHRCGPTLPAREEFYVADHQPTSSMTPPEPAEAPAYGPVVRCLVLSVTHQQNHLPVAAGVSL